MYLKKKKSDKKATLKVSKYKSDKKPASVDLPMVINSAESWLLLGPNAIFVATGVIENINIPTNP